MRLEETPRAAHGADLEADRRWRLTSPSALARLSGNHDTWEPIALRYSATNSSGSRREGAG